MDTTRRRPRSPVLGRLYTQLLPDYTLLQEPPAHRALSYYPIPSSCIWLLSQTHPQKTTTFCCHTDLLCCSLATRTDTGTWAWRSCALLSNCLGGHISLQSQFFVSPFTRQCQCLPALCSKTFRTQGKTAGNAKMHHNRQRHFHKGLLTSSSAFDAVKSYLHQVLDLKLFLASGKVLSL